MRSFRVSALSVAIVVCAIAGVSTEPQGTPGQPEVTWLLRGVWKAQAYQVASGSPLNQDNWGPGATFVRDVNLTMMRNGRGLVTIYTSAMNRRGFIIRPSARVIEVELAIVQSRPGSSPTDRIEVRVLHAHERSRYGARERRTLTGVTVSLSTVPAKPALLTFRYDSRQEGSSFEETLRRLPR